MDSKVISEGSNALACNQPLRSSTRLEHVTILKEKKRLGELNLKGRESKSQRIQYENDKEIDHVDQNTKITVPRTLSSVLPSMVPSIMPIDYEDFDVPDCWKKGNNVFDSVIKDKQAVNRKPNIKSSEKNYPRYRTLIKNAYKLPLQRGSCLVDDIPQCSCDSSGCGESCQNRLLFMECCVGNCSSLNRTTSSYCNNTSIQRRSYPATEVFNTGPCGYGLKVCVDIECDVVVVEYTGEVITASECSSRMYGMTEKNDFYFASLGGGLMLDAKNMGSVARFANHSCDPNCELQKWNVLGESCIALVTKKPLLAGTEMTYNYQYFEDGLDSVMKMKRQRCLCGADTCSGTP
jgi:hypothetical protein